MKKLNFLKYLSGRVLVITGVLFVMLLFQTADCIYLSAFCDAPLWRMFLWFLLLLTYTAVIWGWLIIPYQRAEKLVDRFLDGHILSEGEICHYVLLSPSTWRQMETIDRLMKSPQLMDLNKRQAQYLALQNQINPHFLYNTLESIRGEALIAGLTSVADMTEALAKFFRYTITKVENLVTVEEELENCDTYFRIQQYRFGERLKLHVEYEEADREDVMNCKIPKLTLQPILENSIIHGTELKVGTGNLKIQLALTQTRLLIRISDDGVGMTEETLAKLNRKLGSSRDSLASREEEKGGIALVNVNNRIQLIFGEEYGMHVYSIYQKGTDVEITIPRTTNANEIKGRSMVS